jgi:hypothetical protein
MDDKRMQIIYILAFPVVITIGIVLIPVVTDYTDHRLPEQAVDQTGRWFAGHIIAAIGFGLSVLAVGSINRHLQLTSRSLPGVTLPSIAVGAGLYAAGLGADCIGPLAVRSAGYSPVIFFDGSSMWVNGTFMAAALVFAIGLLSLVNGSIQRELLRGWSRYVSLVSAIIFLGAPAILSGWALYGVALAAFGVFVPFALEMSK